MALLLGRASRRHRASPGYPSPGRGGDQLLELGPAPVLAAIVGTFHVTLYVAFRGSPRGRLPFMLVAAFLGALAGQAVGARLGDPVRIGDFGLVSSSVLAWVGIGVVAVASTLGPGQQAVPRGRSPRTLGPHPSQSADDEAADGRDRAADRGRDIGAQ